MITMSVTRKRNYNLSIHLAPIVILSVALQRNAKHKARLSNISGLILVWAIDSE